MGTGGPCGLPENQDLWRRRSGLAMIIGDVVVVYQFTIIDIKGSLRGMEALLHCKVHAVLEW